MTAPNGLVWFLGALALGYVLILAGFARRTSRRRPRLTAALCILALAPWAAGVWAVFIEPETLRIREITIESEAWSGPPLRMGLISDSHVGAPHMDLARLRRVIARMNAEYPDIVVLLGDYAGGDLAAEHRLPEDRAEILAGVAAFRDLRSPLGTWAVLGNHDSWFDEVALDRAFEAPGFLCSRTAPSPSSARAGPSPWPGSLTCGLAGSRPRSGRPCPKRLRAIPSS
jgi:hypothetical protein